MEKITIQAEQNFTVRESFNYFLKKCAVKNLSPKTLGLYEVHFSVL